MPSAASSPLLERPSFRALYGRPLLKIVLGALVVNAGLKWAWYSLELERKDISYANRIAVLESELKQAVEDQKTIASQTSPSSLQESNFGIPVQASPSDSKKSWWKLW